MYIIYLIIIANLYPIDKDSISMNIIKRTLKGEKTARVPVAPFIHMNYVDEFFSLHNSDPVVKTIEVYDYFGFDIIFRNSTADYLNETFCDSRNWMVTTNTNIINPGVEWSVETIIKTPDKELREIKEHRLVSEFETVFAPIEYFIKDYDDFQQFVKYQPPVPAYDFSDTVRAREILGERGCVAPWAQGAFNMASMYRKLDDLLLDIYLNPRMYSEMMEYFSNRMFKTIEQYAINGADMVSIGGNVAAGGLVGADYFEKFILPYEKSLYTKVNDLGLYSIYHNCGDAKNLLPLYPKVGMSMYESLTPPPYGDTILDYALDVIPSNITLSGGFDQISLLRNGSDEAIEEMVRSMLEKAKKRGNFIIATTDYFNENTPAEKVAVFAEAALKYGIY